MRTDFKLITAFCFIACAATAPATAEIVAAGPDHYTLKQQGVSPLPPEALWARLIKPAEWWRPDHTYSGDAANLSLKVKAGGLWREDWDGGSVAHGIVLLAKKNEMLRLDAPFGPLQEMGVSVIWTIALEADEDGGGTTVTFTEIANGSSASKLDELAPAVDFVKTEAMKQLTAAE